MSRLSESLLVCIILWLGSVSAQAAEEQPPNLQLWKSFQQEIKTLEEAAHRVNTLLNNAVASPPTPDKKDSDAEPAENPLDVTVFANPDTLKNGVITKTNEPIEKGDELVNKHEDKEVAPSVTKPSRPSHLNLGSFFNPFGIFRNMPKPWWKGENVCMEQSEKEEKPSEAQEENKRFIIKGTGSFEHCKQTPGKYICTTVVSTPTSTKTVSSTYQCCEGFRRQGDSCVQVTLKSAVEVLDSVDCREFASLLKSQSAGIERLTGMNVTYFAPVHQAMQEPEYNRNQESNNQVEAVVRQTRAVEEWNDISPPSSDNTVAIKGKDIVFAHATDSLLETDDFTNEMVVKSLYNESPLRINIYPGREEPVVTVNCARILSADNLAAHARIHTIDRRLNPVTQTVMDILSLPQFSQFRQYLEQENFVESLTNSTAITVFAPNNDAWDRLSSELKEKYTRGELCIKKVLRNHILPLTLCGAPMSEGRITTSNINGEMVRLTQNQDGQILINDDVKVIQKDIVTENGVIHVIEKVLIPKSAKPVSEWLSSTNHSSWLAMFDKAGLTQQLDSQENITLLVPSEQALAQPSTRSLLDSLDIDSLRQVLLYHVTERVQSCDMDKRTTLNTQSGQSMLVTMINPYSLFSGIEPQAAVQCVPLSRTDGQACHAVTHEVSRLLLPPNSTALSMVSDNSELSVFKKIMEGTAIETELAEKTSGFTLLVPTDDAFNKLDDDVMSKLLSDKKFADDVLRMHILKDQVCCASITSVPWPFTNSVTTVDNKKINVSRDRKNNVIFGNAGTEICDIMGTDGIVHIIDNVLLPDSRHIKLGNVEFGTPEGTIMLFGI